MTKPLPCDRCGVAGLSVPVEARRARHVEGPESWWRVLAVREPWAFVALVALVLTCFLGAVNVVASAVAR